MTKIRINVTICPCCFVAALLKSKILKEELTLTRLCPRRQTFLSSSSRDLRLRTPLGPAPAGDRQPSAAISPPLGANMAPGEPGAAAAARPPSTPAEAPCAPLLGLGGVALGAPPVWVRVQHPGDFR